MFVVVCFSAEVGMGLEFEVEVEGVGEDEVEWVRVGRGLWWEYEEVEGD